VGYLINQTKDRTYCFKEREYVNCSYWPNRNWEEKRR